MQQRRALVGGRRPPYLGLHTLLHPCPGWGGRRRGGWDPQNPDWGARVGTGVPTRGPRSMDSVHQGQGCGLALGEGWEAFVVKSQS